MKGGATGQQVSLGRQLAAAASAARQHLAQGPFRGRKRMPEIRFSLTSALSASSSPKQKRNLSKQRARRQKLLGAAASEAAGGGQSSAAEETPQEAFEQALAAARAAADWERAPDGDDTRRKE